MTQMLAGKVVLVTGAAGGIGAASSAVLARHGARIIISDINQEGAESAAEVIRSSGHSAAAITADLADPNSIRELIEQIVKQFGGLHGAFNNAGIEHKVKPLAELSLEEWGKSIAVNLTSVFLCMKFQIPAMLDSGGGSIVNTASSLGQVAIPNCSEYIAAKHGVIGLTRAASADYSALGIRVNAILPGIIETPMVQRALEDPVFGKQFDLIRARHSMGRFGAPKEVGEACAWLLSDASSFVTGSALPVDGGYLSV